MKTKKTRNPFALQARRRAHVVIKSKRRELPRNTKHKGRDYV